MTSSVLYSYKGKIYPEYLKHGNACQFVIPFALQFCKGKGLDIGSGRWPLPGAKPVDLAIGYNAMTLPDEEYNYIFSSHCLEHLQDPVKALEHWKTHLKPDGVLFLYLPHPDMKYWRPQHCRKHLHMWYPRDMVELLTDLGFKDVIHSERDLAWSFSVVGFNGQSD